MKLFALLTLLLLPAAAGPPAKGKTAGNPGAPITVEIFSDFQCPGCKVVHEQAILPLIRDYVMPGKVYLIHRSFPLAQHPHAKQAAIYADAAARVGLYEEVATALFSSQNAWGNSGKVEESALKGLAPATAAKIRAIAKDPAIAAEVEQDVKLAQATGINRTPTIFVTHGGKRYPFSGTVNYAILRSLLDGFLKK